MGFRELNYWIKEARRKSLSRRLEAYEAALLPHQQEKFVRDRVKRLTMDLYEIDHEGEIDLLEMRNKERISEARERLKSAKQERRRRIEEKKNV